LHNQKHRQNKYKTYRILKCLPGNAILIGCLWHRDRAQMKSKKFERTNLAIKCT
jgi:hypothetical protein